MLSYELLPSAKHGAGRGWGLHWRMTALRERLMDAKQLASMGTETLLMCAGRRRFTNSKATPASGVL